MTLAEAAETGTHKVIGEHSTIGLVVTTDGTFTDIPRENYVPAEKRVIEELSALGKPFVVLVNSADPDGEAAQAVCDALRSQYGVEPVAVNCLTTGRGWDRRHFAARAVYEFPVCEIGFVLPRYIGSLPAQHPVQASIYQCIRSAAAAGQKMRDLRAMCEQTCRKRVHQPCRGRASGTRERSRRGCASRFRSLCFTALSVSRPAFRSGTPPT